MLRKKTFLIFFSIIVLILPKKKNILLLRVSRALRKMELDKRARWCVPDVPGVGTEDGLHGPLVDDGVAPGWMLHPLRLPGRSTEQYLTFIFLYLQLDDLDLVFKIYQCIFNSRKVEIHALHLCVYISRKTRANCP